MSQPELLKRVVSALDAAGIEVDFVAFGDLQQVEHAIRLDRFAGRIFVQVESWAVEGAD